METPLRFEWDNDARHELQDIVARPGFKRLMTLVDNYVAALQAGAQAVSMEDPLQNRDRIAAAWAYANMGRNIKAALEGGIRFELDLLNRPQEPTDPEELYRLRRTAFALDALAPLPTEETT